MRPAHRATPNTHLLTSVLIGAALLLTGCSLKLPYFDDAADDQHRYTSTPWLPQTVTIVDTRTGEEVWTRDVPVGRCLILHFAGKGTPEKPYDGSTMHYVLKNVRGLGTEEKGRVTVPTLEVRRVDVSYRDTPEDPPGTQPQDDPPQFLTPPPPPSESDSTPEPMTEPQPVTEPEPEPAAEPEATEPEPIETEPTEEAPIEPQPADPEPTPEPEPEPQADPIDTLPPPPPPLG
ncbi:MAG: hypothetical protein AAF108_06350 [Planctomycetota bacterium]